MSSSYNKTDRFVAKRLLRKSKPLLMVRLNWVKSIWILMKKIMK